MNKHILTIDQSQKLQKIFSKHKEILAAYIFGSTIKGKTGSESDVDLAIFKKRNSRVNEYDLLRQTKISDIVPDVHLSVVSLSSSSPLFLKQIIGGICIYKLDIFLQNDIEADVMSLYYDSQHLRDIKYSYLQKRIEGGTYGYR